MEMRKLEDLIRFSDEKMQKLPVFDSAKYFCDLYCLKPGQDQRVHTKVPPEGIARLMEHYTEPGDIVLDSFCGSGMTGVAARLTGRHAVLSDLSPAAVHIARGYAATLDPGDTQDCFRTLLEGLAGLEEELYGTACPACGQPARVEYTVWSDVYLCPRC